MSSDTLTSVGLLRLDDEETMERTAKALVERAEKSPPKPLALQHPFFRLAPIERFLLTALHLERWSHSRISRVLGVESKMVAPWAWATRMKLIFQESALGRDLEYPKGPTSLGSTCPEYDISQPWTQRLLDDECEKRERLFLQGHLMACPSCRKSLEISRKMIFKVESLIPVKEAALETEAAAGELARIWREGESSYRPLKTTFAQSVNAYLNRTGVQYALLVLIAAAFSLFKRIL
ncbi:MAG: zf-HC2 domain-containing protein [Bdellovibrionales bacterium]|nr:zf-HC2 domain-containing protein [Bdellovibrionales bacterium]